MYVVITGASRGIGKQLAYEFASHKYNLILTCKKNIDILNDIKSDIENKYNVDVYTYKGNIYDDESEYINKIKKDVYIVINNQSIADYDMLQDVDKKIYDDMIDSNMTNAVFTTKYFVDDMIKQHDGKIIFVSSVWGEVGASNESIYSMTKGGINIFAKSIAKELKDCDIDVLTFSLGMVDTDMNKHFTKEDLSYILEKLDNKKMFDASFIAKKIYDIVSSNEYISGDIIEIDNGIKNF